MVKAALARERRRAVRRRLVALAKILEGKSIKQAARAGKATRGSVERWLRQVRQSGLQALLVDRRRRYAKQEMTRAEVRETRGQIATALARPLKPQVHARLIAIETVLSGKPVAEAAISARVLPNAVRTWLRVILRDGVDATVSGWQVDRRLRPGKLEVDPAALRELAVKEINPRVRKRMLAVACVAEGMSTYDAEAKVGLGHQYITKRVRRFQEEGIAGFRDRKIAGRPRLRRKARPGQGSNQLKSR